MEITDMDYSGPQLMAVNAARLLQDGDTVLVGVGLPNIACNLAQRTHAPNLVMIYEAGVVGSRPRRLPLSIGDPTLVSGAQLVCSMYDLFSYYLQRGNVAVGFLGGAQIDRYGNINATVIGSYLQPKIRLPGSGGSMEIAGWANRCYIITPHQRRRFPEKVDFCTSAGFLGGGNQRQAAGVRGRGPQAIVTNLGLLEPGEDGELLLAAVHPGVSIEQVREATSWALKIAPNLRYTLPPSSEELHILCELDPDGIHLKE
jgi:glutaconate CoA-transferase subunit B